MLATQETFCDSALLTQISGLACDEHDNIYACNFGTPSASIVKIDKHGNATLLTEPYGSDRNFVSMVYLDKFLYVTGFNNCVYKVDSDTGKLTTFTTLPDVGTNGITFYDGAFYVTTQDGPNSGNVYKVNRDGEHSVFIEKTELIGTQYNSIVHDKEGNFYITDEGNNTVVKYSYNGKLLNTEFILGTYQVLMIHNDDIYVTNYTINQISQYDMYGKLINANVAVGGLTFAGGGMLMNKKGDLYCSLEGEKGPGSGNVSIQMITSMSRRKTLVVDEDFRTSTHSDGSTNSQKLNK
jgi:sugar lactone lactonase YvrE